MPGVVAPFRFEAPTKSFVGLVQRILFDHTFDVLKLGELDCLL